MAVNDEVPSRIDGWFTLESIANPCRTPLGPMVTNGMVRRFYRATEFWPRLYCRGEQPMIFLKALVKALADS